MDKVIGLIVGGTVGTAARYALSGFIHQIAGPAFPYGTLAVNVFGCFIIGILAVLTEEKSMLGPQARILLMVGFCGAFTTFSTFMLEIANLIKDGAAGQAFLYVAVSLIAGFALLYLGVLLARAL